MGMYTKFEFHATLKCGVDNRVIDYLKSRLIGIDSDEQDISFNDHPFFKTKRWGWILTSHHCCANSYESLGGSFWDCDEGGWKINIDTILKNYDHEIEWFIMWIAPYIETSEPVMITRHYEEYSCPELDKDCKELINHVQGWIEENPNKIDPEIFLTYQYPTEEW